MALISKTRFLGYQNRFHKKVTASPMVVQLRLVTVITPEDEYEAFTGDSDRQTDAYEIPCLYKRDIEDEERNKYGWSQDVDGVLYFSPIDLTKHIGTFKIDSEKTTFIFNEKHHKIDQVEYLEPYYDSCVGVRIAIKSMRGSDINYPVPAVLPTPVIEVTRVSEIIPNFASLSDGSALYMVASDSAAPIVLMSSDPLIASVSKVGNLFTVALHKIGTINLTFMQSGNTVFSSAVPVLLPLTIT